nr:MAG TPA: hypothetical protein [Bacteriophage sp.]
MNPNQTFYMLYNSYLYHDQQCYTILYKDKLCK